MKKICVAVFTLMLGAALSLNAGQPAKSPKAPYVKTYDKGTTLIFTNLQGPNHHKYNPGAGYYVDSSTFYGQTLAQGFVPSSNVGFADAYMPMGVYTSNGGTGQGTGMCVTLNADNGGVPSDTAILDPPSGCLPQSNGIGLFPGNFVEFDCVSCPALTPGTLYWIVASDTNTANEFTWDFSRGLTDTSSPFAFKAANTGYVWTSIPTGYQRSAYEVDGY